MPADPEKGYGWEKLMTEQLATYYMEDHGLDIRLVRFHNIYGPLGTWDGGKEKVPAAIMRKISEANAEDTIEVWGDGLQTRSFCYVDDCVEGLHHKELPIFSIQCHPEASPGPHDSYHLFGYFTELMEKHAW